MPRHFPRASRVASLIKEELPSILAREVKDPRVGFITVTAVEVSPDMHHARVMVSVLGEDEQRQGALQALGRAAGFIRRALASRLQLRQTPELSFKEDTSLRDGARIEQLITEWKSEHPQGDPSGEQAAPEADPVAGIVDVLRDGSRFLFTAHLAPDGDSLGSALALAHALWNAGKLVHIINRDRVPRRYRYLPGVERVEDRDLLPDRLVTDGGEQRYDAVFCFECPDVTRTGWKDLCARHFVVNIDHHQDNSNFGNLNWVDTSAPAVGAMVHDLIRRLELPITPEVATCIYTAVMTDTGSYTYSNTTAASLRLGADMVDLGASAHRIALAVYDSNRYEKVALLGKVLARMERAAGGRVAWLYVTLDDLRQSGADCEEADDFVNYPRSIEGVDVALIFKEVEARRYKVSLRSKHAIDVFAVAKAFGGGGHKSAAGCTVEGELDAIRAAVLERVEEELRRAAPPPRR